MDDSQILDFLTIALIIGLCLYGQRSLPKKTDLQNLDSALALVMQGLHERLTNLDDTADRMLSAVPQVNLTNQNPLISIIEAFQAMRQGSNNPAYLRDNSGRFETHGETEKQQEHEETIEAEIIID